MAVWICWNFTKPRPVRRTAITASITIIRLAIRSSLRLSRSPSSGRPLPADVQQHPAVDAMPVPRLLAEERRRIVLGLHRDEAVVAAQAPASGVPVHAAADVAGEEGLVLVHRQRSALEGRRSTHAARDVRHDRTAGRCGDDEVAAVVEKVRRPSVEGEGADLHGLGDAECTADLTLDGEIAIEIHRDASAEVVVAEARTLRVVLGFGEER